MNSALPAEQTSNQALAQNKKTAENFLGGASDLVNLENLVTPKPTQQQGGNPFLATTGPSFNQPMQNQMTLNQMKGVNTPALPAAGTTMMAPINPGGPGIMPPTYPNPMMNYGMQPMPGMNMAMGTTMPMMGMNQPANVPGNVGQMNNNPFL